MRAALWGFQELREGELAVWAQGLCWGPGSQELRSGRNRLDPRQQTSPMLQPGGTSAALTWPGGVLRALGLPIITGNCSWNRPCEGAQESCWLSCREWVCAGQGSRHGQDAGLSRGALLSTALRACAEAP